MRIESVGSNFSMSTYTVSSMSFSRTSSTQSASPGAGQLAKTQPDKFDAGSNSGISLLGGQDPFSGFGSNGAGQTGGAGGSGNMNQMLQMLLMLIMMLVGNMEGGSEGMPGSGGAGGGGAGGGEVSTGGS